jgi:hypothetical protein
MNWYPYDRFRPGDGDDVNDEWLVWGDGRKPLARGTEDEVKAYVLSHEGLKDLYIEDPEGEEYAYEEGHWVPAG